MNYYYSLDGRQHIGPLSLEELLTKDFECDTLVWKEGLSNWIKASEMPELAIKFVTHPSLVEQCDDEETVSHSVASVDIEELKACQPDSPKTKNDECQMPKRLKKPVVKNSFFSNDKIIMPFLSFKGRARRTEYWIVTFLCNLGIALVGACMNSGIIFLTIISFLVLLLFTLLWLSARTRRCHDLGHNGFWQFIPLYGLFLLFQDSEPGFNRYGRCSKSGLMYR